MLASAARVEEKQFIFMRLCIKLKFAYGPPVGSAGLSLWPEVWQISQSGQVHRIVTGTELAVCLSIRRSVFLSGSRSGDALPLSVC